MPDVLEGAGLEAAPPELTASDASVVTPEPPEPPDESIQVPEGAQNPDAVRNAIAAERRAAREANARRRDLEAQLAAQVEASKPLEERIAAAEAKAVEAERRVQRVMVAATKGLPVELAERLAGDTVEAITADADKLLALFGDKRTAVSPAASADGGYRPPAPAAKPDPSKAHSQFVANLLTGQLR